MAEHFFPVIYDREITPSIRRTKFFRNFVSPLRFDPFSLLSRIPDATIWNLTRVDPSTISRWKSGESSLPFATEQLLRYAVYGDIPYGFGDWHGCRFGLDGNLYLRESPVGYSAGEITAFYLIQAQAGRVPGLLAEVARLAKELNFHEQLTRESSRLGFMQGLIDVLEEA